MSLYLPWCVYLGVALLFSWLTWRTLWAQVPPRDLRAPPAPRTSTIAAPLRDTPLLFGLNMLFYGGMAGFEVAQSLGL